MIIVTSYNSPDLDGIACSIAYSELLNSLGKKAKAVYSGDLGLEVEFVRKYSNYFPIEKHQGTYDSDIQFVLVDTADPDAVESTIPVQQVVEIYDHRQIVFVDTFINSRNTIELVGSCATLITEQFQKSKINPSSNCALYLYSAIVSNTINFKNTVTTVRDIQAAQWLKEFFTIPKDYVKQMFASKSQVTTDNFQQIIEQDFAVKSLHGKKIGIAQLEIVDLKITLNAFHTELDLVLKRLKELYKLDYIFFSGIDIFEGYNIFITIDSDSNLIFAKALGIPNLYSGYRSESIIMRKEIVPKLEGVLKNANY